MCCLHFYIQITIMTFSIDNLTDQEAIDKFVQDVRDMMEQVDPEVKEQVGEGGCICLSVLKVARDVHDSPSMHEDELERGFNLVNYAIDGTLPFDPTRSNIASIRAWVQEINAKKVAVLDNREELGEDGALILAIMHYYHVLGVQSLEEDTVERFYHLAKLLILPESLAAAA